MDFMKLSGTKMRRDILDIFFMNIIWFESALCTKILLFTWLENRICHFRKLDILNSACDNDVCSDVMVHLELVIDLEHE